MILWKNPTEQDIEKNLEIAKKGKGELTLPLAILLNGAFKKRYKEEVGGRKKRRGKFPPNLKVFSILCLLSLTMSGSV